MVRLGRGWIPSVELVGGEGNVAKAQGNGTATAIKLQPLGDRVVVQPAGREETTRSGIVIPDTAKEKPQRGTVIAVGEGRRDDDGDRIPMDVQVGDSVLFAKYGGTEFKYEDEEYLILSEKDILAKVED
jgi:chaperonin GroES